ncbi:MAG: hypothetical protein C0599_11155, partial [Salinivirgaceae bacterium]
MNKIKPNNMKSLHKKLFVVTLLTLAHVFSFAQSAKDVDLSIDKIFPAVQGNIPNNDINDADYPFYGGFKYVPKHIIQGFSTIGLPVNHPGEEAIDFDWQLTLTKDPEGAASVVFDQTESFNLSTGEADTILFGSAINQNSAGKYRLTAALSSANDANSANNTVSFNYEISDTVYGYADKDNLTTTYVASEDGGGIGIVTYFPAPVGDPYILKSVSTYISDEYTGVINNGNATIIGVVYDKDLGTGNWDLSGGIVQTNPLLLDISDVNKVLTLNYTSELNISSEKEYLIVIHILNNNDPTDDGKISFGADPNKNAPNDLRCVQVLSGLPVPASYTPGIWANVVSGAVPTNTEANFTAFSIPNQVSSNIDNGGEIISVTMPSGTDLTNLIATYALSTGASADISGVPQESGVTSNDFSVPVVYTVTAEDGVTTKNWTVNVDVAASAETNFTAYSLAGQISSTIDAGTHTIDVTMADGADLTNLAATFTLSNGASADIGGTPQESGVTANDFSNAVTYTVTAEDGTTTQEWTVNVSAGLSSDAEILSYSIANQVSSDINATEKTVSVVMPSGTDLTSLVAEFTISAGATAYIDVTEQESGVTINDFTNPVEYAILAEDATTQVIWTITVTTEISNEANILTYSIPEETSSNIDGAANTIDITVPTGTDVTNLVATFTLSAGASATIDGTLQESGITANDFTNPLTYTVTAEDGTTTQDWIVTITAGASSETQITDFTIEGQTNSTIDSDAHTIDVSVPVGTDVTNLVATFTLSAGASATIDGTLQESGVTTNDFTNPLTYTITAEDETTTQDWVVTVTEVVSSEAEFVTYSLEGQISSSINSNTQTIDVSVSVGTDVSNLVASFTLSTGATAAIDGTPQESGVTANDFSSPITYTLTAEDGITTQNWVVTVSEVSADPTDFISYSINGNVGVFDANNPFIRVEVPQGSDLTQLIATFEVVDGTTVRIGTTTQESGVTVNDFSDIVTYRLVSATGSIKKWYVQVIENANMSTQADFLYFGFYGQTQPAEINTQTNFISVNLDPSLNASQLMPIFYLSDGAIAYIGNTIQWSGQNVVNLSSGVSYTVVAEDGVTTEIWTVQVTTNQNISTDILSFGFTTIPDNFQLTTINEGTKTVSIKIPAGTSRENLIAEYDLSPGATAYISGIEQFSGVSTNDYSTPVIYTIVSQNGSVSENWIVNVGYQVGIDDNNMMAFQMYPNPATKELNIKESQLHENKEIVISNLIGQTVYRQKVTSINTNINISDFDSGVYL